jgi:alcohol dehydrogenase (cytochrome c)/quinohemoprotein ethanol dehydrogenase
MSFSPGSPGAGLVYIPVQDLGFPYKSDENFQPKKLAANYGVDVDLGRPPTPEARKAILDSVKGRLLAWDPVAQKQVWAVEHPGPWNGGVLSTAGNLVFEGIASGHFEAYRAGDGKKLWSFDAQTGVMAGPVSYTAKGQQYVAVAAGWGGIFPLVTGEIAFKSGRVRNISRVLAFTLGGKASLPPIPKFEEPALDPPPATADEATVKNGERIFQRYCSACHGDVAVGGGVLPDLRYSKTLANDNWFDIALGGSLRKAGMVSFAKELSRKDAEDIRAYVIFRAHQTLAEIKHGKR